MPIVKGGYEVLDLVAGPKESVELEVDCFLCPPAGFLGAAKNPLWLTTAIPLQKIPIQATGDKLKIWEMYKVKTGLFCTEMLTAENLNADQPLNGPNGTNWAASGLPLTGYPTTGSTTKPPFDGTQPPVQLLKNNDMTIQEFCPNPWSENTKYFSQGTGGGGPFAVGDNNSTVVLLSDEHGFGIMCPQGFCYLSSCDYFSQYSPKGSTAPEPDYPFYWTFQCPRYFTCYFRQRWVRSPVLLSDLFQQSVARTTVGFQGETGNIENVVMGWGTGRSGPSGLLNNTGVDTGIGTGKTGNTFTPSSTSAAAQSEDVETMEHSTPTATATPDGVMLHQVRGQRNPNLPGGIEIHFGPKLPPKTRSHK